MFSRCFGVLLLCCSFCVFAAYGKYSQEVFAKERDHLEMMERQYAGYDTTLSDDEKIVNHYLEYLKMREFNRTRTDFPPSRPIVDHLSEIPKTKVFQVLKKLPKGGNLHLHHNHVVSKEKILDILEELDLYKYLCIDTVRWRLDLYLNPPPKYVRVLDNITYFTKENILSRAVFTKIMTDDILNRPTDSGIRWKYMSPLFGSIGHTLIDHANVTVKHMEAMLQAAMDENVQYLETKASSYRKLYLLDPSDLYLSRHGKRLIDGNDGEVELEIVNKTVEQFKIKNPDFIGYRRIISSSRGNKRYFKTDLERAVRLHRRYPTIVSGFDLVGEEDKGYSLLFFMKDIAMLDDKNETVPVFFHTAETNWPDDLLTSIHRDDPFNAMQNVYESVIVGAKRVGHGIGFAHHPYLLQELKRKQIAVEANPVSNKMLGYVPDQRHHPAISYLRSGIPVVLGSDDPATFGYDNFTLDWYEIFMGWGLNLADLRQLANNSLTYSSMEEGEKKTALAKWKRSWDAYITAMKKEACQQHFNSTPIITSVYPDEGHFAGGPTTIRVFGRNFEKGICTPIVCKFGDRATVGQYVYNYLIHCPVAKPTGHSLFLSGRRKVPFSVSLDAGLSFTQGNASFTYINRSINIIDPAIVGK